MKIPGEIVFVFALAVASTMVMTWADHEKRRSAVSEGQVRIEVVPH